MSKNKKVYNNGVINKYFSDEDIIPEGFILGKLLKHSPVTTKGKKWYNNGKENLFLNPDEEVPEGFKPGKLQKTKQGKFYTDGIIDIKLAEDEEIPEGFTIGRHQFNIEMSEDKKLKALESNSTEHFNNIKYTLNMTNNLINSCKDIQSRISTVILMLL